MAKKKEKDPAAFNFAHLKILAILQIMEQTDADHPLTTMNVVAKLHEQGLSGERKSVLRDLHSLMEAGYVAQCENHNKGFYLATSKFQDYELKILADAVGTAKFLTQADRLSLLKKLRSQATTAVQLTLPEAAWYDASHSIGDPEYTKKLETIMQAIAQKKVLEFQYYEQNIGEHKKLKWNGYRYSVDPYYLLPMDGEYFLLGSASNHDTMQNYRVQMMTNLHITDDSRRFLNAIQGFSDALHGIQKRLQGTFNNWGAEELHSVVLHCEQYCLPAILLAFGTDIPIHEREDLRFSVTVSAPDNHGFYAWLAKQGSGVTLEFPLDMRKKMGQFLQQSLRNYADVLEA